MRGYVDLLSSSETLRLAAASAVGRVGQTSIPFVILLGVQRSSGSFATAGLASGIATAIAASGGVVQGRLVDRIGPTLVLPAASLASIASASMLAWALSARADGATLIALSAATGSTVPAIGAITRTMWTKLVPAERRSVAYALDAVITEVAYIAGPALASAVVVVLSPSVAVVLTSIFAGCGGLGLAFGHSFRRDRGGRLARKSGPLARRLLTPFAIMFGIGVASGFVVVAITAFATHRGERGVSGLLLAIWGAGSALGAAVYGTRPWGRSDRAQLVTSLAVMCVTFAPLGFADSFGTLGLLLVLAGIPIAPAYTTLFLSIDRLVPRARRAEAFAWVSSVAPGAGLAGGMIAAGWVASSGGVATDFAVADATCIATFVIGLLFLLSTELEIATGADSA